MPHLCPGRALLAVEHPGQIHDVERAIETIGGTAALEMMADDPASAHLELRFQSGNRFEHPIKSSAIRTGNLLIKVTQQRDGQTINHIAHEPVASIRYTARFRDISDFQWSTAGSPFVARFNRAMATRDAQELSLFNGNRTSDATIAGHLDLVPPPVFSNTIVPHTYSYLQNPQSKKVATDSGVKLLNRSRGQRQHLCTATLGDITVPAGPSPELDPNPSLEIQNIVERIRQLFDSRPMWTRRGLVNMLDERQNAHYIKFAIPYVAYKWRSGPWRDCYAKYNTDPRSDPVYADFQAIYCLSKVIPNVGEVDSKALNCSSHLFDGKTLYPQGRLFMFIDMTDPILVQIRERSLKRDTPHVRDGWWRSNMIHATRTILRGKLTNLCSGVMPSDRDYAGVLKHANDAENESDVSIAVEEDSIVLDALQLGFDKNPSVEDSSTEDESIDRGVQNLVEPIPTKLIEPEDDTWDNEMNDDLEGEANLYKRLN